MDSGPSPWTAWYSAWLSLNVHLHMLFVDGVYTFDDEAPRFRRVAAPTQAELQRPLHAITTRVTIGVVIVSLRNRRRHLNSTLLFGPRPVMDEAPYPFLCTRKRLLRD